MGASPQRPEARPGPRRVIGQPTTTEMWRARYSVFWGDRVFSNAESEMWQMLSRWHLRYVTGMGLQGRGGVWLAA